MMPSSASPARRILPTPWVLLLRDRLAYFRTLTLMLALLTLWGLSITYSLGAGATNGHLLALGIAAAGLTATWIRGLRRRNFPLASLGLELALVLAFMWGGRDDFGAFGLLYVALQFRALFGTRREAFIVACAVGATYIGGHSVLPGGMASLDPVVAVEIAVGGFCVYLMHTLSEVLVRDQERKRALQESEQRFRSVIENLREALLISDPDDTVLLANARVLDVLGYEPSELIGQNVAEVLVPPAARDAFRARKADRMQGRSDLYETILKRKDGTLIHAEISASPYRDSSGTIVGSLGAISDISERKRLEGRLRQGMRLEAVGQLAGGVAHDFNNLLTVIKCHTELLLGDLPHGDPNRDSVVEIDKSTDRGASLTQQLLAFSRKQLLQPQRISVAQVVANSMAMLRGMVAPHVGITARHNGRDALVFADPLQLEHVLAALIRNANDAIAGSGTIDIETRTTSVRPDFIPVHNQEMLPGDYVLLSVADTGRGMSPDVVARIFEPFMTTKSPGAGSGLGLASVYGSVRQSGGFIAVESAPNAGTTFRIWLPVHETTAASAPAPVVTEPEMHLAATG